MVAPAPEAQPFSAEDEQDYQQARRLLVDPPAMQKPKTQILLITLLAFVGASFLQDSNASFIDIGMLVGVILFHEVGHMIAMRIVGYRDVRIFFIPFFGGAAAGTKRGVARWKEGVVLLCGPLPGIALGTALAYADLGDPHLRMLTLQLIIVNALNLLPISPLDGGQLFSVLLFSRQRHLELIFVGATAALLAAGGILGGLWVLGIIGFFILFSLAHKKRILDVAQRLRPLGLPSDPAAHDDAQARALYRATMDSLPAEWRSRWRGKPLPQAQTMEQVLERATLVPPSANATAALLAIWFAGLVVAFVGLAAAVGPSWRPYTNQQGHFAIDMPAEPTQSEIGGMPSVVAQVGGREYTVSWLDAPDPAGWLGTMYGGLAAQHKLTDLRTSETERVFKFTGSGKLILMRLVAANGRGYLVGAAADDDEPDSHRFIDSFRALP